MSLFPCGQSEHGKHTAGTCSHAVVIHANCPRLSDSVTKLGPCKARSLRGAWETSIRATKKGSQVSARRPWHSFTMKILKFTFLMVRKFDRLHFLPLQTPKIAFVMVKSQKYRPKIGTTERSCLNVGFRDPRQDLCQQSSYKLKFSSLLLF